MADLLLVRRPLAAFRNENALLSDQLVRRAAISGPSSGAHLRVLNFGLRSGSATVARRIALTAAILWLLYAIYEWRMFLWSQTVSAPIRVDLLLIAPMLYLTTVAGLVASIVGFLRISSTRNA